MRTVVQSYTVQGTVDTFDRDDFKSNLANAIGIARDKISLSVESASVRVTATIEASSDEEASSVNTGLANIASSSLSAASALLGVTVVTISPPTTVISTVVASPPPVGAIPRLPPAAPPSEGTLSEGSSDAPIGAIIGGAAGGAVLIAVAIYFILKRRGSGVPKGDRATAYNQPYGMGGLQGVTPGPEPTPGPGPTPGPSLATPDDSRMYSTPYDANPGKSCESLVRTSMHRMRAPAHPRSICAPVFPVFPR